jgi:hypothetical protein
MDEEALSIRQKAGGGLKPINMESCSVQCRSALNSGDLDLYGSLLSSGIYFMPQCPRNVWRL